MRLPLIPYFKTSRYRVEAMVELSQIKPGEKVADLGSGDGRIVIAFAQAGAEAYGYELRPVFKQLSEENIHKAGVQATIYQKDFWEEDLSSYDVVTVYPMPDIMDALEKKLLHELKPESRVLLNYYFFPTWKEEKKKDAIYLYRNSPQNKL